MSKDLLDADDQINQKQSCVNFGDAAGILISRFSFFLPFLSLSHFLSSSLSYFISYTLSLFISYSLSHAHTLEHTNLHSLKLTITDILAHTHWYTHTHTQMHSLVQIHLKLSHHTLPSISHARPHPYHTLSHFHLPSLSFNSRTLVRDNEICSSRKLSSLSLRHSDKD